MRDSYVLTYFPKKDRLRRPVPWIDVKVKRSGVRVRARKGYYAVQTRAARRSSATRPRRSPCWPARRCRTRSRAGAAADVSRARQAGLTPLLVTCRWRHQFLPSDDKKTYTSDSPSWSSSRTTGQVLDKVSQRYRLNGPIERLAERESGDVLSIASRALPRDVHDRNGRLRQLAAKGHGPLGHISSCHWLIPRRPA